MKLSILNQSNDLRLNALVKQQTQEHQHIISGHHKEMQELRDALHLAMERFESISKRNDQDLKDFRMQAIDTINFLKIKVMSQEAIIAEQRQMITDLHKELLGLQEQLLSKADAEKMKNQVQTQMTNASQNQTASLLDCQRTTNSLFASLKDEVSKLKAEMELKFAQAAQKQANDFAIALIDRDGVLKELIRYKKEVLIIEKKIENIYTLIERLNGTVGR